MNISISDNYIAEKESVKFVNTGGTISLPADTDVKESNDVCRTLAVLCHEEIICTKCGSSILNGLLDCQMCDKVLSNLSNFITYRFSV